MRRTEAQRSSLWARIRIVLTRDELGFPSFWQLQVTECAGFYLLVLLSVLPYRNPGEFRHQTIFCATVFLVSCLLRPPLTSVAFSGDSRFWLVRPIWTDFWKIGCRFQSSSFFGAPCISARSSGSSRRMKGQWQTRWIRRWSAGASRHSGRTTQNRRTLLPERFPSLKLQHGFHDAQVSLWVDGDLAFSGKITGAAKKKFGLIPTDSVRGSLSQIIPVRYGQHSVRVRIEPGDAAMQEDSIGGDFAHNTERDLSVSARAEWAIT